MTPLDQQAECRHIISTRIAILCEEREPTPEQEAIARAEALDWVRRYNADNKEAQGQLL